MSGLVRRPKVLLVVPVVALVVAACQQQTTIVGRIQPRTGEGFLQTNVHVREVATEGAFQFDGQVVALACTARIVGTGQERSAAETVDIRVAARGSQGVGYEVKCTDPLILQFPLDAHSFRATGRAEWGQADLPLRAGLSSIPIGPGRTLDAEPGHQLVEVDYTPDIPPGLYRLRLDFQLATPRSIAVKALIVAEVACAGQEFLPPVLPQVESLAQLPSFVLPARARPAKIRPDVRQLHDASVEIACA